MKQFLKENLYHILLLLLVGMVLIFCGRLIRYEFSSRIATESLLDTADLVRCAEYFGWQVDRSSKTQETVYIPKEFDAVWTRYNELQRLCSFDLSLYRGKSATRHTFRVLNFPGMADTEAFINLLVIDGRLIGGDCFTVALDGVMLPLDIRSVH